MKITSTCPKDLTWVWLGGVMCDLTCKHVGLLHLKSLCVLCTIYKYAHSSNDYLFICKAIQVSTSNNQIYVQVGELNFDNEVTRKEYRI